MLLAEKFIQIELGTFENFIETKWTDETRKIHSVGNSNNPAGYFFEESSYLASPWTRNGIETATLFLGADSYVNSGGYLRGNILIGRYCSIGRRVTIGAGSHNLTSLSTSPRVRGAGSSPYTAKQRELINAPASRAPFIKIESDVWIGDGAVILPGVTIAVGSVIGANAVVVEDTKPYEIVGGVPARKIRKRFADDTIKELQATEWWEGRITDINALPTGNIFEFLDALKKEAIEHHALKTWRVSDQVKFPD